MEQMTQLQTLLKTALGEVASYLEDATLVEVMVNPDGSVWIERLGQPMEKTPHVLPALQRENVIRLLASHMGLDCGPLHPSLSAILPTGERFQGFLPPVARQPWFTIRKPAIQVFTLADYVQDGICTQAQADVLTEAVLAKKNIMIVGSTGSGKSTLANALLAVMATTGDRILTIEDTPELQCTAPNYADMYTRDGIQSMQQCVKDALRSRPTRIVVGETRDGAVLEVIKAWGTGHPGGISTIHADPGEALERIEELILEVATTVAKHRVAKAINLIVTMERGKGGPQVTAIEEVLGYSNGAYQLRPLAERSGVCTENG